MFLGYNILQKPKISRHTVIRIAVVAVFIFMGFSPLTRHAFGKSDWDRFNDQCEEAVQSIEEENEDPIQWYRVNQGDRLDRYSRAGACITTFGVGVSGKIGARCSGGEWISGPGSDNSHDSSGEIDGICYEEGQCEKDVTCECGVKKCEVKPWTGTRAEEFEQEVEVTDDSCSVFAEWSPIPVNAEEDLDISGQRSPCTKDVCFAERKDAPFGLKKSENSDPLYELSFFTGDHMMALSETGADGYIDMRRGLDGERGGHVWVRRERKGGGKYIMIPTKGLDFQSFVQSSSSVVTVTESCYRASFGPQCEPAPACIASCTPKECRDVNCDTDSDGDGENECSRVCKCPDEW